MTLGVMEQIKHLMTAVGSQSLRVGSSPAGAKRQFSRLDRRRFLRGMAGVSLEATSLGALAACRRPAAGPVSKRLPLIGYFSDSTAQTNEAAMKLIREGLQALGYREGRTIRIEHRYADGDQDRWPALAQELIDLHPDVIVAQGLQMARPLLALTRTIPTVVVAPFLSAEDLIADGSIKSQVHPGGNLTGLIGSAPTLAEKRLDLLHEAIPSAARLAVLRDSSAPDPYRQYPGWTAQVISLGVSRPEELDGVFARFEQEAAEVLAVTSRVGEVSAGLGRFLDQIAEQARRHRLPAIADWEAFTKPGGLMSYGPDQGAMLRGVGRFVDKILKGASPAELPVELAATFRFIINKATANALGLTISPAVLAQATEVLQ